MSNYNYKEADTIKVDAKIKTMLLGIGSKTEINLEDFCRRSGITNHSTRKTQIVTTPNAFDWNNRHERAYHTQLKKVYPELFEVAEVTYGEYFQQEKLINEIRTTPGYNPFELKRYYISALAEGYEAKNNYSQQNESFYHGGSEPPAF